MLNINKIKNNNNKINFKQNTKFHKYQTSLKFLKFVFKLFFQEKKTTFQIKKISETNKRIL